jgi:hypothetical protein
MSGGDLRALPDEHELSGGGKAGEVRSVAEVLNQLLPKGWVLIAVERDSRHLVVSSNMDKAHARLALKLAAQGAEAAPTGTLNARRPA